MNCLICGAEGPPESPPREDGKGFPRRLPWLCVNHRSSYYQLRKLSVKELNDRAVLVVYRSRLIMAARDGLSALADYLENSKAD